MLFILLSHILCLLALYKNDSNLGVDNCAPNGMKTCNIQSLLTSCSKVIEKLNDRSNQVVKLVEVVITQRSNKKQTKIAVIDS